MAITLSDFNKIWASSSPLTPYSFSDSNYEEGWNFVGSTPPARQMWDGYMKFSDEKQQYIVNNFLPLAGGTMTGTIETTQSLALRKNANDGYIQINSGIATADGANLILCSKGYTGALGAGSFQLTAKDENYSKTFLGKADGTFTWNGQAIQTSSDRNLKTDFADIPAEILDKWENVKWQQFHYKDAKEQKGDSCRFHIGLVAQDVEETCGEEILKYGILCKEDEIWMVRYTEALCMEVAFLRNKIAKLEDRLAKLEK